MPRRRLGRSFDPIAHIERPVRRFFRAAEAPLPAGRTESESKAQLSEG
ncbi:hypothetical protein SNOG_00782 [Parastagonospora nodorum SN15]|uniref:Uncharacterized protein n=1 Tax=Phaeosphaeria nodorum (strain SN15 / ATCC MYA-4574 / FGSC 10173) TaxID=321614 RepID=Q0V5D2_PHANO|nr:hypothetical protein SNOG_00782 [Parastagonospora nodorum SN15]EAT92277.1 hypothetical protein SNOG_00782 [Parastagonospora nodorum SN15]